MEKETQNLSAIAEKAVLVAVKQVEAGLNFRQPRMNRIKQIEDMYNMVERPALVGRFSVPFDGVVMRGYIDTLMSKLDEITTLQYSHTKGSAMKAAKKIEAAWRKESSSERANWKLHDRWSKKQMCLTGRAYIKSFGERNPDFNFNIENVDGYDMVTEPNGGGDLNAHLFTYQLNIFRSASELKKGVEAEKYSKEQVDKLSLHTSDKDLKQNDDDHANKVSRFASTGLDAQSNNYVGEKLYNLTEGVLTYEGEKYYILFDRKSGIWVRFKKFKDVFKSGLIPWVSYSSDDDAFSFLNLGPADAIYPIAESMYLNLNGMLNNMRKKNDDMIAYDPRFITDPSQLIYRPEGLIAVAANGGDIRNSVMNMRPDDVSNLAINLHGFMNNFLGESTGITAGAKGVSDETKVGIYMGNQAEVADRIGRHNKSYSGAMEEIGRRFDWALWEHADESYMVEILGEDGVEWTKITKEDKDPDYLVTAKGGSDQQRATMVQMQKRSDAIDKIVSNQTLLAVCNPKVLVRELAKVAEIDDETVLALLNKESESNALIVSEAERLIENCLSGKKIQLYRGADAAFLQHIHEYTLENRLDMDKFLKLQALMDAHLPIVVQNTNRKLLLAQSARVAQMAPNPAGAEPVAPEAPVMPPIA